MKELDEVMTTLDYYNFILSFYLNTSIPNQLKIFTVFLFVKYVEVKKLNFNSKWWAKVFILNAFFSYFFVSLYYVLISNEAPALNLVIVRSQSVHIIGVKEGQSWMETMSRKNGLDNKNYVNVV